MWHATLPKSGKSLLVANLALALAAGGEHAGFTVPSPKRVLICQFELPTAQFALRLTPMRKPIGKAADSNLFIDTAASGHLLSAPRGWDHFLRAIETAKADVVILDPLYSTHDQDENDTRSHGRSLSNPASFTRCFRRRFNRCPP
jgi:RecA-family ATPase